jgi:guanylate kinase
MTREEFIKLLPQAVKGYEPPAMVLSRIRNVDLLMMVGGTGVGKTSIIKQIGAPYVVADITRPIRPDEINGLDYFFRTDYEQLINEIRQRNFVQVNIFETGDFYGTRSSAYPEIGFAVVGVVAEKVPQFRNSGFNETITAFITPPEFLEWMGRLDRHNVERDQLGARLAEARKSYEFALQDNQTHFVLNDVLEGAVNQTKMLLAGQVDRNREAHARAAAELIYKELSFIG